MKMRFLTALILILMPLQLAGGEEKVENARPPKGEADLRQWLQNMVWHHQFTKEEIRRATGLSAEKVEQALKRFAISKENKPGRAADAPILVLPYPGGRHPRIGFLEGAIRPQRETKVSIFTPWHEGYVVADIPEAIWSNLGLTYLAHTHVPTVWTRKNVELKPLEWEQKNGTLVMERRLPNGIVFGTRVVPGKEGVRMEQWLTNGTKEKLTGLRVQNCVMLKGAKGFAQQKNENKIFKGAYAVCHSPDKTRWIITAWKPIQRAWGNARCPCLHADPQFPDCPPGATRRIYGWLSFYEGKDIEKEIARIEKKEWWK